MHLHTHGITPAPDREIPSSAEDLGFREGLGIDDVCSIKENAQLQGKQPTDSEMLAAFTYYLENDAFIEFPGTEQDGL